MRAFLAAAVFVFGAVPLRAEPAGESILLLLSLGAGVQNVDLPRFGRPDEEAGWRPQVAFGFGVPVRTWLEPFADLSFAYLQGADAVSAPAGADTVFTDTGTLTQAQGGFVVHGPSAGSVRPFARVGAGVARWSEASPGRLEVHATDALWSGGGGVEWRAHRHLVLRGEAVYTGQRTRAATRSHTSFLLRIAYAFTRDVLTP